MGLCVCVYVYDRVGVGGCLCEGMGWDGMGWGEGKNGLDHQAWW